MLMPDKLELHNVMPVTLFAVAARLLTSPDARTIAAKSGNIIGHHALMLPPTPSAVTNPNSTFNLENRRIATDPDAFYGAIPRAVTPAGDLYPHVGGLFICVWREDAIDKTTHFIGSSSVGFMLSRDELGRFRFDIARSTRVEGAPDDEATAFYKGAQEREGFALGELINTALISPAPHRALETSPHFVVFHNTMTRN